MGGGGNLLAGTAFLTELTLDLDCATVKRKHVTIVYSKEDNSDDSLLEVLSHWLPEVQSNIPASVPSTHLKCQCNLSMATG